MVGFSNGKLNQSVVESNGNTGGASFLAKLGYDKQINDDFRFRLTGSLYNTGTFKITTYILQTVQVLDTIL